MTHASRGPSEVVIVEDPVTKRKGREVGEDRGGLRVRSCHRSKPAQRPATVERTVVGGGAEHASFGHRCRCKRQKRN